MPRTAKKKPAKKPPQLDYIAESLRPLASPLDKFSSDPANARRHDEKNLSAIVGSLRRYGQRKPIVVNRRTGIIEAGNGTLEAARALGWSHIAAVLVDDDAATATGFAIADNRTAELAEWDMETLEAILKTIDEQDEDLAKMLADLADEVDLEGDKVEVVEDEVPDASEVETRCKPGDLWLLGEHRLLCGDSTDGEAVKRLMDGEKAGLCFTSPPYAQQREYTAESREKVQDWDGLMQGVFGNLPMTDAGQVLVNLGLVHRDGEWLPYWEGWIEWMRAQGWRRFGWYVWDKLAGMPGDWGGRLAPSHEFVFHFNRNASQPLKAFECKDAGRVVSGRTRGADGEYRVHTSTKEGAAVQTHKIGDSVVRCGTMKGQETEHPATMPVSLADHFIRSWPGIVYEPFSGSGTTIIAAHQLNRRCYGLEISPAYCDVILARWEKLTGRQAEKA